MKKQLRTYPKPYIPGENYDYEQDTPLFYDCSHHPELLILPFLYQPL